MDDDDFGDFLKSSPSQPKSSKPAQREKCSWLDEEDPEEERKKKIAAPMRYDRTKETVKDLEDKITLEKRNNARLQSEIERLSNEIKISKPVAGRNLFYYVPEINTSDLKIGKEIGKGRFSTIFVAEWLKLIVAFKDITADQINQNVIDEFNNEQQKLFLIRHPNIISLYGVYTQNHKLSMILELAPKGTLFDLLHRRNKDQEISMEFKYKLTMQIINAMNYLHTIGFVHRDLKSKNILFNDDYEVKITGFGLCKSKTELSKGKVLNSGTPAYMAPELYGKKGLDEKIDVFSFGTLIWEIFTEQEPFEGLNDNEIKTKVCNGEGMAIGKDVPKKVADLISLCRHFDSKRRPSFQEMSTIKFQS